jgi:hypothetical protein
MSAQGKIVLQIKDPKDVLVVADALLKSGYTVSTPKRKVGAKWETYVVATRPDAADEGANE